MGAVNLPGQSSDYTLTRTGTTLEVWDRGAALITSLTATVGDDSALRFRDGAVTLSRNANELTLGGLALGEGEALDATALALDGSTTSEAAFAGLVALPRSLEANAFLTITDTTPDSFRLGEGLLVDLLGNSTGKTIDIPIGAGVASVDPATTLNFEAGYADFSFARLGMQLEVRDLSGHLSASLSASETLSPYLTPIFIIPFRSSACAL